MLRGHRARRGRRVALPAAGRLCVASPRRAQVRAQRRRVARCAARHAPDADGAVVGAGGELGRVASAPREECAPRRLRHGSEREPTCEGRAALQSTPVASAEWPRSTSGGAAGASSCHTYTAPRRQAARRVGGRRDGIPCAAHASSPPSLLSLSLPSHRRSLPLPSPLRGAPSEEPEMACRPSADREDLT